MSASLTMLQSASSMGYRTARYGDFVIVTLQSAAFATTAQDHVQAENWARGRPSMGSIQRDRSAYFDRHEILLARSGSGIATKGHRQVLKRIVTGMEQNGMQMNEWSVPHNINESVEIVKKPPAAAKVQS